MPARALTDAVVRSLHVSSGQRLCIYDTKAKGLCLRVTTGSKSWSFVYRPKGNSKQRRYTIGDYPTWPLASAREKALRLRLQVQEGGDPLIESRIRREALTVSELVERFIARYAKPKLRSWQSYETLLLRELTPVMGDLSAANLQRTDIANLLDKVAARAPVLANRLHNTISSVFSWGVSEGLVPANPVTGLRKRTEEKARDRVLSDSEIGVFWRVTESASSAFSDTLRLVLLTGQRPGECAGIRAEEVDLMARIWVIPSSRAKNKVEHTIPLVGGAWAIVARLAELRRKGPLIITPRGKELTTQNLAKAMEALRDGLFSDVVTPHDLRRTAATIMGRIGIDQMTIGRVLNHSTTTKATITGSVYDRHDYIPQKRIALEKLNSEIDRVLSEQLL